MRQWFRLCCPRHLQSDPPRSCGLRPKMHLPVRALKQTLELKPLPPPHLQKTAICLAHNLRVGTIWFHRSYLRLLTLTRLKLEPSPSLLP